MAVKRLKASRKRVTERSRLMYECRHPVRAAGTCSHTISAPRHDLEVWSYVSEKVTDPRFIEAEIARHQSPNTAEGNVPELERMVKRVDRDMTNVAAAIGEAAHAVARTALTARLDALAQQKTHIERELARHAEDSAASNGGPGSGTSRPPVRRVGSD